MSKKETKTGLRTYRYEEFQSKIDEGADNVGFDSFKRNNVVTDYEDEISIDDEGVGKELNINKDIDVEIEDTPTMADTNTDALDLGDKDFYPSTAELEDKLKELLKITKNIKGDDMKNIYNDINKILTNPKYSTYVQ